MGKLKHILIAIPVLLFLFNDVPLTASEAPPSGKGFPTIRVDEEGHLIVEDRENKFKLSLPGHYWEVKSPAQITSESKQRGGCAGGGKVPPGLLLVMRNKDAPVAASLEIRPERYLLRGKEDLKDYMDYHRQMILKQGKDSVEEEESTFDQKGSMIVHKMRFVASGRRGKQTYQLVHYCVRPKNAKARTYRLACVGSKPAFDRLKEEFDHIVSSFQYTGETAESFFTPGASPEETPDQEDIRTRNSTCPAGGGQMGMLVAMAGVFLIYMWWRKRKEDTGL
ncbi:MAG: hypothetical protein ACLFWL_06805 [Candidatus Brocadiia bacterium]